MLQSLAEADLERLSRLDLRCRELFSGLASAPLNEKDAALAEAGLRAFLEFHQELRNACESQRDAMAGELKALRAARQGAKNYQDTEDLGH